MLISRAIKKLAEKFSPAGYQSTSHAYVVAIQNRAATIITGKRKHDHSIQVA